MTSRILWLLTAAFLLATNVTPALADDEDWAGMYQGLDSLDGSIDYMSIVPLGNGMFDIRIVPSRISICDTETGAGVITALGRLTDEGLVREKPLLKCFGLEPRIIKDSLYTRDDKTGILTPLASYDGRKHYFHRIGD